jgi:hypothetical protein
MTSAKKKRTARPLELNVVFDTNALYTGSASDLVKQEVAELIEESGQHQDLSVNLYLPEIVRHERQFQMLQKALGLLPSIRKVERVLGVNLNITEDIIEQRVHETVERQLRHLNLRTLSVDIAQVDWNRIMLDAAYRRPPFELGEKEKGFRDALIAETFLQLVSSCPVSPKVCRIVLVSNDNLLFQATESRTVDSKNVKVLRTLEELKGLINTLASKVSEDFVASIQKDAEICFYDPNKKDSIYYKEDILATIETKFKPVLRGLPSGADLRENGQWTLHSPRFIRKERQRVYWASRIEVEARVYRYRQGALPSRPLFDPVTDESMARLLTGKAVEIYSHMTSPIPIIGTGVAGTFNPSTFYGGSVEKNDLSGLAPTSGFPQAVITAEMLQRQKELVSVGKSVFEVNWSIAVTTRGRLSQHRIESIDYIETVWE